MIKHIPPGRCEAHGLDNQRVYQLNRWTPLYVYNPCVLTLAKQRDEAWHMRPAPCLSVPNALHTVSKFAFPVRYQESCQITTLQLSSLTIRIR